MKKFFVSLICIATLCAAYMNVYAATAPLTKLPAPVANYPNGSTLKLGDKVTLSLPQPMPNTKIVTSLNNADVSADDYWRAAPEFVFETPAIYSFWAKTTSTVSGQYMDSDPVKFMFNVRPDPIVIKVIMNQLKYTVNGKQAMFDVPPYLDTKIDRSMIPMRFIAEAFGGSVNWDDAAQTQTIALDWKTYTFVANKPLPGGMGTPVLVKDRFFVPLRYAAELLGATVDWDNAMQSNTITLQKEN